MYRIAGEINCRVWAPSGREFDPQSDMGRAMRTQFFNEFGMRLLGPPAAIDCFSRALLQRGISTRAALVAAEAAEQGTLDWEGVRSDAIRYAERIVSLPDEQGRLRALCTRLGYTEYLQRSLREPLSYRARLRLQ